jgi:hypothetical protein
MELQMNQKNTFSPHLPLNETLKHQVNAILPPFIIEGQDGATWDEMLW